MAREWILLHGGALGDLALAIHVALRVVRRDAGTALHVISRIDPGDLATRFPLIRRRSSEGLGTHWLHADDGGAPPAELARIVAGRAVLNALGDEQSSVHHRLKLAGAQAVFSFDTRPQPGVMTHITRQWEGQLARQGLAMASCAYAKRADASAAPPAEFRAQGRARFGAAADGASPIVLIHPGSGGAAKCWPAAAFGEVRTRLEVAGMRVFVVIGPVERERRDAANLRELGGEPIEPPDGNGLIELLCAADLLIGNDSGPSHLAALLGVPTLTLFGPTPASVWRPLGPLASFLRGDANADPTWGISAAKVSRRARRILTARVCFS